MSKKKNQLHQTSESRSEANKALPDANVSDAGCKTSGKRKVRKSVPVDDGRTVANMNVEGMPWYRDPEEIEKQKKASKLRLTLKERFAVIWASYRAYLPRFLTLLAGYAIIALMLYFFWLK